MAHECPDCGNTCRCNGDNCDAEMMPPKGFICHCPCEDACDDDPLENPPWRPEPD